MKVIKSPHPITSNPSLESCHHIFLAGSIEMGAAEDWQARLADELINKNVVLYNPRRDEWDSSWEQSIMNPQFYQQVNWEMNALEKSHLIVMYFSPETKSPISLLELGLHAASGKMIVCCPEGFWRKGNVDMVCDRYNIPNFDSLEKMIGYLKENSYI